MSAKVFRSVICISALWFVPSIAPASITITAYESNGDVIFSTPGGTLDISASQGIFGDSAFASLGACGASITVGTAPAAGFIDGHIISVSGPANFVGKGPGGNCIVSPTSGTGNLVGVGGALVTVPDGYVSGSQIGPASMTFAGESYESMEITPGTYVWNWPGESITLEILPPPAPEAKDVAINIIGVLHPHHDGSPSSINGLNDVINVVIYGSSIANGDTENFIANQIDPASLRFGPAEGGVTPGSSPVFDVDVDSDGDNDAQFEFLTGSTGLACISNEAMLAGETNTGEPFQGMDSIATDCDAQCHN